MNKLFLCVFTLCLVQDKAQAVTNKAQQKLDEVDNDNILRKLPGVPDKFAKKKRFGIF
jgi:hypothetical protein